jgi:hypothetical protein
MPWESLTYYQVDTNGYLLYNQPLYMTYWIPAQSVAQAVANDQQFYGSVSANTLIYGFVAFGPPIILVALGLAAFWAHRRILRWLIFIPSLVFWLVGAGLTLYSIGLSGFYGMDSCCHGSVTQAYGTLVVLLGYGSVLLGVILILRAKSS